jgi:hypothetical protein
MTHAIADRRIGEKSVLVVETLPILVDRIEKAMRPLGLIRCGPDHDRVRRLYANLVQTSTGNPLELARRAVLYEILYAVMRPCSVGNTAPFPAEDSS